MELTQDIPTRLRIAGHQCIIRYRGQRQLCFLCGQSGHMRKDCSKSTTLQAPVTARSVDPPIPVNTEAPPVSSMELAPSECVVSSVVTSTSTMSTSLPLAPVSGVLSCHSGQSTVAPLSTTSVAGATVLKVVSALDGGLPFRPLGLWRNKFLW